MTLTERQKAAVLWVLNLYRGQNIGEENTIKLLTLIIKEGYTHAVHR